MRVVEMAGNSAVIKVEYFITAPAFSARRAAG